MDIFEIFLLLATGTAGGFLSGLLGVGGGIIFVPALVMILPALGVPPEHIMHVAVGSSLGMVLLTGTTSARGHHKRDSVEVDLLKSWLPFIVFGVAAGSYFASSVDGMILKKLFAVVTAVLTVYMVFGKEKVAAGSYQLSNLVQGILCFLIGAISALMGIGGAILAVPMMSYMGISVHRAVGTGAAMSIVISLPATFLYIMTGWMHRDVLPVWSLGYVDLLAVLLIAPVSMFMVPFGVKMSHHLPRPVLRRIFAAMLVVVTVKMFLSL